MREKIRRERDQKIIFVRQDVSAIAAHPEVADPPAHQPNPKSMGQLMAENVKNDRAGQPEKSDQPEHDA